MKAASVEETVSQSFLFSKADVDNASNTQHVLDSALNGNQDGQISGDNLPQQGQAANSVTEQRKAILLPEFDSQVAMLNSLGNLNGALLRVRGRELPNPFTVAHMRYTDKPPPPSAILQFPNVPPAPHIALAMKKSVHPTARRSGSNRRRPQGISQRPVNFSPPPPTSTNDPPSLYPDVTVQNPSGGNCNSSGS
jgi:hypothetical protein